MKFEVSALLLGAAATAASAQQTQEGPFKLHVQGTSTGSKINGFLGNCHTGASLSAVCYSGSSNGSTFDYYFNSTASASKVGDAVVGSLTWNLPYTDPNGQPATVNQAMSIQYQSTSNIAAPQFGVSNVEFPVGFDQTGSLFGYNYIDDSKFVPGVVPTAELQNQAYYQWAVCWQYFSGYYYQSLAWVTLGAPHNPTCEYVKITKA